MRISPLVNIDPKGGSSANNAPAIQAGDGHHLWNCLAQAWASPYIQKSAEKAAVHPTMMDSPFLGRVSVVHVVPPTC